MRSSTIRLNVEETGALREGLKKLGPRTGEEETKLVRLALKLKALSAQLNRPPKTKAQ